MTKKIIIDPLTRISGFLEIQVEVENHKVVDAKCIGLLYRGFEKMLKGRKPFDAVYFTERICGICSTAHAMASSLAIEDALKVKVMPQEVKLRNIIHGFEFLQNHIKHFYLYVLPDYIKTPNIDPISSEGTSDLRLPKAENKLLAEHYLKSITYTRMAHEGLALLGGKAPHPHGIQVGGVTKALDIYTRLKVKSFLQQIGMFIQNIMLYDLNIITKYYSDYFSIGKGYGNLMTYGLYNDEANGDCTYVSPGIFIEGKHLPFDLNKITENIHSSWYKGTEEYKPGESITQEADVTKPNAYSFVISPRYEGKPMEVGPLARMWLSKNYNRGISVMDRIVARVLETKKMVYLMECLLDSIEDQPLYQSTYEIPDHAIGQGLIDTTRGALGHWISIENKVMQNYDIVTPSMWNLSPVDNKGIKGVVEKALIGTEVQDTSAPVEIGRVIRSFDPCVSCATHLYDEKNSPYTFCIQ